MSSRADIVMAITTLVDDWHAMRYPADLGRLWDIRKDLVGALSELTKHVKKAYGDRELAYAIRKHDTAREILAAMEADRKTGAKARPMNLLTIQAENLDSILAKKQAEIDAMSDLEETLAVIKMTDKALFALSQEINDGMNEKQYSQHLEGLRLKENGIS